MTVNGSFQTGAHGERELDQALLALRQLSGPIGGIAEPIARFGDFGIAATNGTKPVR
jgi:hypothetical protein